MEPINRRVLLIEDDQVDQLAFKRLAKSENLPYDYTIAGSVAAAQEILERDKFDVVITDYRLGDGDAFDVFEIAIDTPVVVVTGVGDEAIAVKAMKAGAMDYLIKDPERHYLITLPATVDNAIKHKRLELELRQRDRLLHSVSTAVNRLLTTPDYSTGIQQALAIIGQAAAVDRVYIFENHLHPDTSEKMCSQRFEWARENVPAQIDNPTLQNFSWEAFGLTLWYKTLAEGKSVNSSSPLFPAGGRDMLESQGIQSLLLVPIFMNGHCWGFIGFDDCHSTRVWSKPEESILLAMAASIGGALKHQWVDAEREVAIIELREALAKIKTLRGLIPICASCKKIRDDQGFWTQVEVYIRDHSEAEFSHGICPECVQKLYPDFFKD